MNYSPDLQKKIVSYYISYYQSCGLPDYRERAENRLYEETEEIRRLERLQLILNKKFSADQRHFVFGAGTGGLAVSLYSKYNCGVYGIEPSEEAMAIIRGKCRETGISFENFKREFGEKLSFADNKFDFVHCFTVLEHVKDIEECLKEMIRVLKPSGYVYIYTPNYKYPYEGHYKITFPTFLPKIFGYFYLFLLGRPYRFLKSINFVTEKQINKVLSGQKDIYWFRIYESPKASKGKLRWLFNFLKYKLFIYPQQEIVIRKI